MSDSDSYSDNYSDDFDDTSSGTRSVTTSKARVTVLTVSGGHHFALRIDDKVRILRKCLEEKVGSLDGYKVLWNGTELKDDENTLKEKGIGDRSVLSLETINDTPPIIPGATSLLFVILGAVVMNQKKRNETPEGRKVTSFMQRLTARRKLEMLAFRKVVAWEMHMHRRTARVDVGERVLTSVGVSFKELQELFVQLGRGKCPSREMFTRLMHTATERIVRSFPSCVKVTIDEQRLVIVGDLKGDIEALERILSSTGKDNTVYLFNGSLTAANSLEVALRVLCLHLLAPNHVLITRSCADDHGADALRSAVHYGSDAVCDMIRCLRAFPLMYIVNSKAVVVHSGLPVEKINLYSNLEEHSNAVMQNEPRDMLVGSTVTEATQCGTCGDVYGARHTQSFLSDHNLSFMIRSHTVSTAEGYDLRHNQLVHSVWSAPDHVPGVGGSYLTVSPDLKVRQVLLTKGTPLSYRAMREHSLSIMSHATVGCRPVTLTALRSDWVAVLQQQVTRHIPWRLLWRDVIEGSTVGDFNVVAPSSYNCHLRMEATWVQDWGAEVHPLLSTLHTVEPSKENGLTVANDLIEAAPHLPTEAICYYTLYMKQRPNECDTASAVFVALWNLYRSNKLMWDTLEHLATPVVSCDEFVAFAVQHCKLRGRSMKKRQQVALWQKAVGSLVTTRGVEWYTVQSIVLEIDKVLTETPCKMAVLFGLVCRNAEALVANILLDATTNSTIRMAGFIKACMYVLGVEHHAGYLNLWHLMAADKDTIPAAALVRFFDVTPAVQTPSLVFRREWKILPLPTTLVAVGVSAVCLVAACSTTAFATELDKLAQKMKARSTSSAKSASDVLLIHGVHEWRPLTRKLSLGEYSFECKAGTCIAKRVNRITEFSSLKLVPVSQGCTIRVTCKATNKRELLSVPSHPTCVASVLRLWTFLDSNKIPHNIGLQFVTPLGAIASNSSACEPYNISLASMKKALHTCLLLLKNRYGTLKAAWKETNASISVTKLLQGMHKDKGLEPALECIVGEGSAAELFAILREVDQKPSKPKAVEKVAGSEGDEAVPHIKETIHGLAYSVEADEMFKLEGALEKAEKKIINTSGAIIVGSEVQLLNNSSIGSGEVIKCNREYVTVRFRSMLMNAERTKLRIVRKSDRVKLLNELAFIEYNRSSLGIKKSSGCFVLGYGRKATPLMYACLALRKHVVEWLLLNGADPNLGCTPSDGISPRCLCSTNQKAAAAAVETINLDAREIQIKVTDSKKHESVLSSEVLSLQQLLKEAHNDKKPSSTITELEKKLRDKEEEEKKAEEATNAVEEKHKEKQMFAEHTKQASSAYMRFGKMLAGDHSTHGTGPLLKTRLEEGTIKLTTPAFKALCTALQKGALTALNLGNICFTTEEVHTLMESVQESALRELNLRSCGLEEESAYEIAKMLMNNSNLRGLYLWNNNLKGGGTAIVEALGIRGTLRHLDLTLTGMTKEECREAAAICADRDVTLFVDKIPMTSRQRVKKASFEEVMEAMGSKKEALQTAIDQKAKQGESNGEEKAVDSEEKEKEQKSKEDAKKETAEKEELSKSTNQLAQEKKEREEQEKEENEKKAQEQEEKEKYLEMQKQKQREEVV